MPGRPRGPLLERLESREMFSGVPTGFSPAAIRQAYGIDQVAFDTIVKKKPAMIVGDGSGQTIAIVDAYRSPTLARDLRTFDKAFGISDLDSHKTFALGIAMPQGVPAVNAGWALEEALDVEWAHAIAPKANILLVEAKAADALHLLNAINWVRHLPAVSVISLSWGGDSSPFSTSFDQILTTPPRHQGITFVTSFGETSQTPGWPSTSPNVVSVGGTSLQVDSQGGYLAETVWTSDNSIPATAPTVAYNSNPATGYSVYSTAPGGVLGWQVVGGTSAGSPQWAAIFAIADQGRILQHRVALDGPTQSLAALDSLPATDFHHSQTGPSDVLDYRTPEANLLIPDLVSWNAS